MCTNVQLPKSTSWSQKAPQGSRLHVYRYLYLSLYTHMHASGCVCVYTCVLYIFGMCVCTYMRIVYICYVHASTLCMCIYIYISNIEIPRSTIWQQRGKQGGKRGKVACGGWGTQGLRVSAHNYIQMQVYMNANTLVWVYIGTYIQICTYVRTYKHAYPSKYVKMHTYTCVHQSIHVYLRTWLYV